MLAWTVAVVLVLLAQGTAMNSAKARALNGDRGTTATAGSAWLALGFAVLALCVARYL